jgi:hypothetical protein
MKYLERRIELWYYNTGVPSGMVIKMFDMGGLGPFLDTNYREILHDTPCD